MHCHTVKTDFFHSSFLFPFVKIIICPSLLDKLFPFSFHFRKTFLPFIDFSCSCCKDGLIREYGNEFFGFASHCSAWAHSLNFMALCNCTTWFLKTSTLAVPAPWTSKTNMSIRLLPALAAKSGRSTVLVTVYGVPFGLAPTMLDSTD